MNDSTAATLVRQPIDSADEELTGPGRRLIFRPAPWLVVRTPLLPAAKAALARHPSAALADPDILRALAIGCPDLLDSLLRPGTRGRDLARAHASLARYLIRMSTRPTPYGTFAAVSIGRWGATTTATLGRARIRTRPDMGWMLGLLRTLDADPVAQAAALWRTNPMWAERDGRLALYGSGSSVRATPAARAALECAVVPITYDLLRRRVAEATGGSDEQVEGLLSQLWTQRLLMTDLQPTLTGPTTVRRLVALVRRTRTVTADALDALLAELADLDGAPAGEAPERVSAITRSARTIHDVGAAFIQTDMARQLSGGRLNARIGAECARAAELLLRMTPAPRGSDDLVTYRRNFVTRYGDVEVPLLQLLDPSQGLGPLGHVHGGGTGLDPQRASERADTLMTVALTALREQRRTIELDPATAATLQTWRPADGPAPLSVELSAFVVARDVAAVDRGDFRIVVGPNLGAPSAGRSLGRFADLLQPEASDAYRWLDAAERAGSPEEIPVEVVYVPANPRTSNVVIRPTTTEHEIVLECRPGVAEDHVIPLDDIVVGVHDGRMYVRSVALGAQIRPTARHMLNHHAAPEVCRFLDEVSRGGTAMFTSFDWGPAESLPYLPRVESGRVVLELARWLFKPDPADLGGDRDAGLQRFSHDLTRWRSHWSVPSRVYVATADNRLLLDLDDPADVEQLHREACARPAVPLRLYEALPDIEHGWLPGPDGGYIAEIVVPLVRAAPVAPTAAPVGSAEPRQPGPSPNGGTTTATFTTQDRIRAPGSDWLFVKLYGARDHENALLTGTLGDICEMTETSGIAPSWFFLRYADPEPHLRVRWKGDADLLIHQLLPHLTEIANALIAQRIITRFTIDTYDRELDRYGGPAGTDVCERIFHADSRAVQQLLSIPGSGEDITQLAVLTVDSLLDGLGLDGDARLDFYTRRTASTDENVRRRAGADYRIRKVALRTTLGRSGVDHVDPSGRLAGVLAARHDRLRAAAADLADLEARGLLTAPLDSLYPSLIHMHLNRLSGDTAAVSEAHVLQLLQRTRRGLRASQRSPSAAAHPGQSSPDSQGSGVA